ncbi:helix-turn-helix transcriptional regulator [Pseudovibrio axinellae]|uniref:helix-turn-helix transcriptional regulator n=1 Tax=Pseudovibrio axinellae TaxID=989403 RepID=UPI001FCB74DA|nr:AraC family transcriptional regulator [Pseudovibrio axinellae]
MTNILETSGSARSFDQLDLGSGRTVILWENSGGRINYVRPHGHTFSFYLEGGTGVRRLDIGGATGHPGAVCVMPAEQSSDWEITSRFKFVHFHVPDAILRASYAHIHDRDARRLEVRESTFAHHPEIATPMFQMAQAAIQGDRLAAEVALSTLIAQLPEGKIIVNGGLSPQQLRRTDEWISANLSGPVLLADLASQAGLSEFHFQRMFTLSRGISPHKWVMSKRVNLAKSELRGSQTIAQIASSCGFSCQSHLTRAFKAEVGTTPARYRADVMK